MTSQVDVANRALSEVGARTLIASFDEASTAAANVKLWYDKLRQMLLRGAHWGFARETLALTQIGSLAEGTSQYPWRYMYAYPADCIKLRYLLCQPPVNTGVGVPQVGDSLFTNSWAMPSRANRFLVGNQQVSTTTGGITSSTGRVRVVLTNIQNAIAVYTRDENDPDLFDPLFENAFIAALASKLVTPLTGNAAMKTSYIQAANDALIQARVADGNESVPSTDHTPDWIQTRGWPSFVGERDSGVPTLGTWYNSWDNVSWGE